LHVNHELMDNLSGMLYNVQNIDFLAIECLFLEVYQPESAQRRVQNLLFLLVYRYPIEIDVGIGELVFFLVFFTTSLNNNQCVRFILFNEI
jgi:hypothetical protein